MTPPYCRRGIGPVIDFGDFLHEKGIPVVIRHVVVPGLTDGADELGKVWRLISARENVIGLAPFHTTEWGRKSMGGPEFPICWKMSPLRAMRVSEWQGL